MAKIQIEGEIPLNIQYTVRRTTCTPSTCVDCVLFDDGIVPWCIFYKKRTEARGRPEFCHISKIIVEENT